MVQDKFCKHFSDRTSDEVAVVIEILRCTDWEAGEGKLEVEFKAFKEAEKGRKGELGCR